MCLSRYPVVVLDLDDTLYLERDYVRSGFAHVAAWLERQSGWRHEDAVAYADCCWSRFEAGVRGTIFDDAWQSLSLPYPAPSVSDLVHEYRRHLPQIRLLPDAHRALRRLAAACCQLWIVTDGPLTSQRQKLTALDLPRRTSGIICTDQWGREYWKPHPRAFEVIQRRTGVGANQCVYVGDHPGKDFIAPRQLGWSTIRVRRPGGLHERREPQPGQEADHEVRSLDHLTNVARKISPSDNGRNRAR